MRSYNKAPCMIWYLLIFIEFLVVVQPASKPVPDSSGTEFLFSIPFCSEEDPSSMYIVPQVTTALNLTLTSQDITHHLYIPAGSALRQAIPCAANIWNETSKAAFRLTATGEIMLYIDLTESSYIVYPEDTISTQYTVVTVLTSAFDSTFFSVTGNFSIINIELPVSLETAVNINDTHYMPGARFNMYLKEDETLLTECTCDLSGIKITSSRPVSIIAGSRNSSDSSMRVIQQLLPDFAWGRRFIFSRHKWMSDNITLSIYAKQMNTDISITLKERKFSAKISEHLKLSMHISVSDFVAVEADSSVMCLVLLEVYDASNNAHHSLLTLSPLLLYHIRSSFVSLDAPFMSTNFIASSESFSHVSFNKSSDLHPFTRPMTYFWNYYFCQDIEIKSPHSILVSDRNISPLYAMVLLRNASYVRVYSLGLRITAIYGGCMKLFSSHGGNGDGIDNDCDNSIDEEILNDKDDDGDGLVDEDVVYSDAIHKKPVDMAWEYYQKIRAQNQETGIAASVVSILISIGVALSGVACFIGFMFLVDKLKQKWSSSTRVSPCS